jgi:hypothetical protein
MKAPIKIFMLSVILFSSIWILPQKATAQISVSFQIFYDELSPYGTWVDYHDYGYVWIPDVEPGFTPYGTNGYWVYTYDGWTWVSNYSWGWAPFHYGRWLFDPIYGPMWVPDDEWGPGWVTWRSSNGYYGWAPIGPGISISIAYSSHYNVPYNQWTFVRNSDFGRTDINNYYINSSNNVTIINNSTVINNTWVDKTRNVTYNTGPDRMEVEKHAGKRISPITIRESNNPGQNLSNDQLYIYRPQVQKNTASGQKLAPSKVVNLRDVKSVEQRSPKTQQQRENQQVKKQQQQQRTDESAKQRPSQETNPTKKVRGEKQPQRTEEQTKQRTSQQTNPDKKVGGEKQQQQQQQRTVEQTKQQPSQQVKPVKKVEEEKNIRNKTGQPTKKQRKDTLI